jgi:hypothetical protein
MAKSIRGSDSIFEAFHDNQKVNSQTKKQQTYDWFRNTINTALEDYDMNEIRNMIITDRNRVSNRLFVGKLYFFFYNDPIYKTTLPYYDTFPLFLLLRRKGKLMFGLNFHYLSPTRRIVEFLKMLRYTTNQRLDTTTRIELPYKEIKKSMNWRMLVPTLRQYRIDRIQGNIINIPAQDWPVAINLPVERFKKASRRSIWRQSSIKGRTGRI